MQVKNKTKAHLLLLLPLLCALCASLGRVYATALPGDDTSISGGDSQGEMRIPDRPGEERKRVLVISNTGAGKSTIINYLLGHTMGERKVGRRTRVYVNEAGGAERPEIGHEGTTCTTQCKAYDREGFCYIDTPGFGDTQGQEQEVRNRLAIHSFVQEKMKSVDAVLILVENSEIQTGQGGKFIDLLEELSLMMHGLDDTSVPNIFFGITKLPKSGATPSKLAKPLKEYFDGVFLGGKRDRDWQSLDVVGIMTEIFRRGHLYPIYPLDGGTSREALLRAISESTTPPIPARKFKLGVAGKDIASLLSSIFKEHSVDSLEEGLRRLEKLEQEASPLLKKVKEIEGIAKDSEEASKEYQTSRTQEEKKIAGVDAKIGALGNLEEVIHHTTISTSGGGYLFRDTMTAKYGNVPFQEKSQVIGAGCTHKEITREPAEGKWEVRFTTPRPRAGVVLQFAALVGVVLGCAIAGAAVAKQEQQEKSQKLGSEAKTLLEAVAIVAIASICALCNKKQKYSPKLEIWCKKRDIYADRLTAFKQEKQNIASRIKELRKNEQEAGERREKAKAEAKGLLATVEASYRDIKASYETLKDSMERITTNQNVLALIEEAHPLMDRKRVKKYPSVKHFMANYQKYKELQKRARGVFAKVHAKLQEVVALETSLSASLGVADFPERVREPGRAFASLRLDGESIVSGEDAGTLAV